MSFSTYLLPLYAVATLFPRLLNLPAPLQQVQLTELIFPLLLVVHRRELVVCLREYRVFFLSAIVYLAANAASAMWAQSLSAGLEAAARGYLLVMVAVTLAYLGRFGPVKLERGWRNATVGVSVLGLLLYGAIQLGFPDPFHWVAWFDDYPYLGRVSRLRGTASTYGMWVMLLLPGMLLCWRDYLRGKFTIWGTLVVGLAILPTFSKEILLVLTGMLLLTALPRPLRYGLSAALAAVLLLGTHYVLLPPDAPRADTDYVVGQAKDVGGGFSLKQTVYVPVHRAAWKVGIDHPWMGVGPGGFTRYSKAAGSDNLPEDFGAFDPHSTWLGSFAETGLPGVVGLLLLVVTLLYCSPRTLGIAGVLLLLFLIASVFKDVGNYRGLWIIVGMCLFRTGQRGSSLVSLR